MGGYWITTNGSGTLSPNISNGTIMYTPCKLHVFSIKCVW
jgi:hypothetical protein